MIINIKMSSIWLIIMALSCNYACRQPYSHQPQYSLQVTDSTIVITHLQQEVLVYRMTPQAPPPGSDSVYTRSGFIHPLRSPSGAVLTDGFPAGHMHQHGLFFAFTNTTFQNRPTDFWNQQNRQGFVQHGALLDTMVQDSFVEFTVRLDHISTTSGVVGQEKWEVKVWAQDSLYVIDIHSTWTNVTRDTLYVHKYLYGGFAFRGSASWNVEDSIHFEDSMHVITSAGLTRQEANHTHPEWIAVHGPVNGHPAGVMIMGAASNFRSPQAVRVHPLMPYFVFAPMVDGAFTLNPGEPFKSKYRILTFDGQPSAPQWWSKFRIRD